MIIDYYNRIKCERAKRCIPYRYYYVYVYNIVTVAGICSVWGKNKKYNIIVVPMMRTYTLSKVYPNGGQIEAHIVQTRVQRYNITCV